MNSDGDRKRRRAGGGSSSSDDDDDDARRRRTRHQRASNALQPVSGLSVAPQYTPVGLASMPGYSVPHHQPAGGAVPPYPYGSSAPSSYAGGQMGGYGSINSGPGSALSTAPPPGYPSGGGMFTAPPPPPSVAPPHMRRIFVGNIGFSANEADIREAFRRYGQIVQISLAPHPSGDGSHRGYCFVEYTDPACAQAALDDQANSSTSAPITLGGRVVRVDKATASANSGGGGGTSSSSTPSSSAILAAPASTGSSGAPPRSAANGPPPALGHRRDTADDDLIDAAIGNMKGGAPSTAGKAPSSHPQPAATTTTISVTMPTGGKELTLAQRMAIARGLVAPSQVRPVAASVPQLLPPGAIPAAAPVSLVAPGEGSPAAWIENLIVDLSEATDDFIADVKREASANGEVVNVLLTTTGSSTTTGGSGNAVKVVVEFISAGAAMKCALQMNHRLFDGRVLRSGILPLEVYRRLKASDSS